jgi:PBP1b-binding outer membrane lipoprotein LpoB
MFNLSSTGHSPDMFRKSLLIMALGSALLASGCNSSSSTTISTADTTTTDTADTTTSTDTTDTTTSTAVVSDADFEATDWTDATHSKSADPNFDEVFNDTQVKRLDFVVTAERWQSMLDNMTTTYGTFGASTTGTTGGAPAGGAAPGGVGGAAPVAAQAAAQTLITSDEDQVMVPAEVFYNGKEWYRVGIRFKGNSTLQGSWQSGILKLSFKMDFDEFEDDYPQIDNQRFYGFKKFSLKNNYLDNSQLREKVASEVFKNAGVPVSHTAFYTLYLDHGNGPEYFGLYTLVEEIDDTVIDTQFSSNKGNLYKPEDGSANFVKGTFNADDFEKKTNEDDADWSDIESLFAALHADTATTDPATWRANLEAVFDVDGFLKYLAVNGIIQNWDTYGRMAHNFYLYNNPATGKLTWIPWDNNEALQEGKQQGALALDFANLTSSEWPLIAKIYADTEYKARYNAYLSEVILGAFETNTLQTTYDTYSTLVAPYATTELAGYSFLSNASDFYSDVSALKLHATSRATAVSTYLNNQ